MLQGLLDAGATITGTWPVSTEQPGGLREVGRAALGFLDRARLPETTRRLPRLQPARSSLRRSRPSFPKHYASFSTATSRRSISRRPPSVREWRSSPATRKVVEADGSPMTVRAALGLINRRLDETPVRAGERLRRRHALGARLVRRVRNERRVVRESRDAVKGQEHRYQWPRHAGILEHKGNKVRLLDRELSSAESLGPGYRHAPDRLGSHPAPDPRAGDRGRSKPRRTSYAGSAASAKRRGSSRTGST